MKFLETRENRAIFGLLMVVSERLRRFVRARVSKEGALYEWGAAARLGAAIGKSSSWVSEYTDPDPKRHADIDTALAICRFYGVSLTAFEEVPEPTPVPPPAATPPLTPHEVRALKLLQRMNEKGQRLSVLMLAGYADAFPKRTSQESPSRASETHARTTRRARGKQ